MERFKPKEFIQLGYFTVYCVTEGKTLYSSSGQNKMVERIVAEQTAYGHAFDLKHEVYLFEGGKLNSKFQF